MEKCFGCGCLYSGSNHKCDPKRENRIEGRHKQADSVIRYEPSYAKRLSTGFAMMRGLVTNPR